MPISIGGKTNDVCRVPTRPVKTNSLTFPTPGRIYFPLRNSTTFVDQYQMASIISSTIAYSLPGMSKSCLWDMSKNYATQKMRKYEIYYEPTTTSSYVSDSNLMSIKITTCQTKIP